MLELLAAFTAGMIMADDKSRNFVVNRVKNAVTSIVKMATSEEEKHETD